MSVFVSYLCDGALCGLHLEAGPGRSMPPGWTLERGWNGKPGDRPRQHFCPKCTKERAKARAVLQR